MKNIFKLFAFAVLLTVSSCGSVKRITYLQDMAIERPYQITTTSQVRIQPDDKLAINVTCGDPQLAVPFNGGTLSMNLESGSTSVSGASNKPEYIVSSAGTINFPVLGVIQASGLTLEELCKSIENRLKNGYISDAMVNAEFTNFQITILGEVSNKGIFPVTTPNLNLLDAIAMAGDLSSSANRTEVEVIRTENGERIKYSVNLLKADLYSSPVFYLQQNDMIYVKPNKYKSDGAAEKLNSFVSWGMSLVSIMSNLLIWGYLR